MLVELCVLDCDDGVDQIPRDLVVRNCLAILHVDLAEDFIISIEDDAGRFHLLEMGEIEQPGLGPQTGREKRPIDDQRKCQDDEGDDRNIEKWPFIPWRLKTETG